jgi:hypothetical protein
MKYSILIPLLLLTACASKKPVVVHMSGGNVPGTIIPAENAESIRNGENLKAYTVGRYIEPDNSLVMHERHTVYRVETTAKWNLYPNPAAAVPMGPVNGIIDAARREPPVNAEIISEVIRQRELTQTLIVQQKQMNRALTNLSSAIVASQQAVEQSGQSKQQSDANAKRLDVLEEQLRSQQDTTVNTATNDTDHW